MPADVKNAEAIDVSVRVLDAITGMALDRRDEPRFAALSLALFEKQFAENPTYRALCKQQQRSPEAVHTWRDIPAVTTSAFKYARLACFPAEADEVCFQTSGTTSEHVGRHYFRRLTFYRAAALRSFEAYCLPDHDSMRLLILGPTFEGFPHSSLGFMFSTVRTAFGASDSATYFSAAGLAIEQLISDLETAAYTGEPVFLVGTSLVLLECTRALHHRGMRFSVPLGSRVLDTGGYKGRAFESSRAELVQELGACFEISPVFIINEYGMTELSSQFYESRLPQVPLVDERPSIKFVPPWTRVVAVDPETLEILPDGETGILRVYDLANIDSVLTIQTEDMGRAWPDRIELLRRASGAELRGCSLLTEALMQMA